MLAVTRGLRPTYSTVQTSPHPSHLTDPCEIPKYDGISPGDQFSFPNFHIDLLDIWTSEQWHLIVEEVEAD
jgi:hypothetical protein